MCGISAIYRFTNISNSDKEKLSLMNREMAYRGPDGNGVWTDDKCGFSHTRLSIIGIENGKQPLFNEDESLVLICNGEIYNYIELRDKLKFKGHVFRSESDCEVILHLYEDYGVGCLEYLRGMFAFVLWNTKTKQMFAVRDRVGEKTLYYSHIQTGIVFSTELKAILKYYIEKPQINAHALAESIRYNYPIELQQTYIEQIKRLRAGEYVLIDDKGFELHKYWDRHQLPLFEGSKEDAKKETLRLLRESVDLCLRSDVPVGVLLSGGIDSSAVAAFAKETGREVHVISAGYKGQYGCDERDVAKRFAKEKGLIYHEVELDSNDFKRLFDEYIQYVDEPVCDLSSMSQWALYKKAKELGFTVLLGGLGGDENFYGYPTHNILAQTFQLSAYHRRFFPWKGANKKKQYLKFFAQNWKHILFAGYPNKIDDSIPVRWTYEDYCKFSKSAHLNVFGEDVDFSNIDVHYSFSSEADIEDIYDFEFTRFMNTLCLYLADRLGMGNSLEIRSPFVDYKLVQFVASLPITMKYNSKEPKIFLKEILSGIVPDYILYAQKRGFTPPLNFIQEMTKDYEYKILNSDYCFYNSMLADKLLKGLLCQN